MIGYILTTVYVIACLVLILFVLLQPGKSDAAAVFGGGASSTAFGPRGTATVLAKVTIGAAVLFFVIAFLFSIPGLFSRKSLGEGVGPADAAPIAPAPVEPAPAVSPSPPAEQTGAAPADSKDKKVQSKAAGGTNSNTSKKPEAKQEPKNN